MLFSSHSDKIKKFQQIFVVAAVCFILFFSVSFCRGAGLKLGLSFPPINKEKQKEFCEKHFAALNITYVRTEARWRNQEPRRGKDRWAGLDRKLDFLNKNGISVMLTIEAKGPQWACSSKENERSCVYNNTEDFSTYLSVLLKRYSGRIDKIQFGNEWQTSWWYVGSAKDFVKFNNILYGLTKKYSPDTQVVLGGFSIGALRHLAVCREDTRGQLTKEVTGKLSKSKIRKKCYSAKGMNYEKRVKYVIENAKYDLADIHLYDDWENWKEYYDMMKEIIPDKEIIISEFGGPNTSEQGYSDEFQASELKEYIRVLNELGVKEAYYFQLVEGPHANKAHRKSGLITRPPELRLKPAYYVFKDYNGKY